MGNPEPSAKTSYGGNACCATSRCGSVDGSFWSHWLKVYSDPDGNIREQSADFDGDKLVSML
jgi:hypothetical protein